LVPLEIQKVGGKAE
jgi:hypothetical protein